MLSLAQPSNFVYFSAYAAVLLLFPRAAGALWASASTPVATLHHAGGDLHPLLRDVRGGVTVSAPVPAVPRAAPSEQAATSPRRLLHPAPDEGFFEVSRRPQPRQVGALERGLGAGVSRRPRAVDAADCRADGPPRRLGAGPRPGAGLQPRAGQDPDPGRERAHTHDGAARLRVEAHRAPPGAYPPGMALHRGERRHATGAQ
jgi:hypothetical protein